MSGETHKPQSYPEENKKYWDRKWPNNKDIINLLKPKRHSVHRSKITEFFINLSSTIH